MRHANIALAAILLLLASCGPAPNTSYDAEALAGYHMQRADSLEAASKLGDAAFEYKLVAELYPKTSHYPNAVRNTALLFSNPANPSIDDSVSLQWFEKYIALPISRDDRAKAEIYIALLKRLTALRNEVSRKNGALDSLQVLTRRQAGDITGKNKKVADLESELKQATVELQRLREVDIRINKRKGTK